MAAIENLMKRKGAFDYILVSRIVYVARVRLTARSRAARNDGIGRSRQVKHLHLRILANSHPSPYLLGPIASMFWHNEEFSSGLGSEISLDGVVCVVDAVYGQKVGCNACALCRLPHVHTMIAANGRRPSSGRNWRKLAVGVHLCNLSATHSCCRQIAGADVVILNKVDLAPTKEHLLSTERLIRQVNPAASVHQTVRGNIDLGLVIGIGAYAARTGLAGDDTLAPAEPHDHDHDHGGDACDCATHYQVRGISSLLVPCPVLNKTKLAALDEWIRTVLWEQRLPGPHTNDGTPLEILRCKGILSLDSGEQYVLQGVREMYDLSRVDVGQGVTPAEGKLVFIGKGLDEATRANLQAVLR